MSVWGWLDRASRVMKGADDPLAPFPNLKRLFEAIDARPAAARARDIGQGHPFKQVNDDEARRALFPSNFLASVVSEYRSDERRGGQEWVCTCRSSWGR